MKKINRTYLMGIIFLILAALIAWQTGTIKQALGAATEPGPKFFPYLSAAGIAVFAVLSMIFDGKKEKENPPAPYVDKQGLIRLVIIAVECVVIVFLMDFIGFWIGGAIGLFALFWTLKGDKKINVVFAVILSVALASILYFSFTKVFVIPMPSGSLWSMLGIKMP